MRKWINILTESTAKPLQEAIVDSLPEQPTKKTYTVYVDGKPKFSMEDDVAISELVEQLKQDHADLDIEIIKKTVPRDTTYEGHIVETIRKVEGGYRLVSKKGKNLGTYPTKAGAEKRERQVQYFKHANEDSENLSEIVWLDENLHKWFKEKWVRFGPDGKIRGDCARGSSKEGKPKCLPQSKAHSLGKKGRASAASKKRREDPNANRSGKAKNVATKPSRKVDEAANAAQQAAIAINMKKAGKKPKQNVTKESKSAIKLYCPDCGGPLFEETLITEKKDACYYKVKSRYKVWPSAYASGALVKCRKKGAKDWGKSKKKTKKNI